MIIQKKFIRKLDRYLPESALGQTVVVGVRQLHRFRKKLHQIGFSRLEAGVSVLPATTFGSRSRFNANGKDEPQKHLPKEKVCWMREWCRHEWRGGGQTQQVCEWRDRCYERYPRQHHPAPSVELTLSTSAQGKRVVTSPEIKYTTATAAALLHVINLFLEIFGECEILQQSPELSTPTPTLRLNWQVLPPGPQPWEQIQLAMQAVVNQARRGNQALIWNRLQTISQHKPAFWAIGQAGFSGYVVLGFPDKHLYVLESLACNNATYILDHDWQRLARLTKAELVHQSLHKARFIHRVGWHHQVNMLLTETAEL